MNPTEAPADETYVPDEAPAPRRRAAAPPAAAPEEAPAAEAEEDDEPVLSAAGLRSGWSAAKQVAAANSPFANRFEPDSQSQIIKFLDDAPYASYGRHWIPRATQKGTVTIPFFCMQSLKKDCPLCDAGDRPSAVTSFNVAIIGDDGVPTLASWDVGVQLLGQLENLNTDKTGPLNKGYYAVSRSKAGRKYNYSILPITNDDRLAEDYGIPAPSEGDLKAVGTYDASIVQVNKMSELKEVAAEIMSDDDYDS